MGKGNKKKNIRQYVQLLSAALTNGYIKGLFTGHIYQGPLKNICVPGLNCYSCPLALGACPIGAMQAVVGSSQFHLAFYVFGFLMMVGSVLGRIVCGFLCPFGFLQDLLYRIPFVKKIHTFRGDRLLRNLKYLILAVAVIILPMFVVDILGQGAPFFCKYICPVGTLEGGILLVMFNKAMHSAIGFLYMYKLVILAVIILLSIVLYRPFCRYLCPLGAVYALFNPIALFRYEFDQKSCISCNKCRQVCDMQIDPIKNVNSMECIRCGKCRNACPADAIHLKFCSIEIGRKRADKKNREKN